MNINNNIHTNLAMSANNKGVKRVKLGELIELCDEKNSEGKYGLDDVRGISTEKCLIDTKANLDGVSLTAYKVVHKDEFAYDTSRRGDKIALALNTTDKPVLISSIYTTVSELLKRQNENAAALTKAFNTLGYKLKQ